ncbi:extracellular solute-binding protein [Aureimonas sp. AU40]|uniref:extracellular solute-binding protein n=1 Tax=Aureimonas sp. AU40 TaxID=1637747 RepID=UPI000781C8FA|nr:extracellular solute-binding protein [Aureimonas sp. AU40]
MPIASRAASLLLASALLAGTALPSFAQGAPTQSEQAGTAAGPAAQEGEWKTWSSIIQPTKYGESFQHYDYVNPKAPKGGALRLSAPGTFDSFNPFPVRGTPAAGFAALGGGIAYDTLLDQAPDEPGTSHALIAEALRYPADFSSATFRLDPDAKFQDGQPITPEDVIWSFETVTALSPLYANYYRSVTKAEKTGEREVTFRFNQTGNRELPNIMGDLVVLPKHWWEGTGPNGQKRDITNPTLEIPVGSGPYRVKSFDAGSAIVWERVPDYWAAAKAPRIGRFNYDEIRYTYFRDQSASWEAYKRGGFQDYRLENSAGRWAQGYNFPAFNDGRVKKMAVPSGTGEPMQGYVMNTRREKFADPRVRQALTLAFNFQDMNKNLFYGLYKRTSSYFQGTELASSGLPSEGELKLLEPLRDKIPPEVFTKPFTLPDYSQPNAERTYLKQAFDLLTAAGWTRKGSQLVNARGEPFTIEFLAADPSSSRTIDPFANQLKRLGIQTTTRIVDVSQYQALSNNFDFDIVTDLMAQSLSPGNEQREFWTTPAASLPGSRNMAGIRNEAVDALVDKVIYAPDRDSLVTAVHALDRVLLWNFYVVPQWNNPEIWLSYWNKFGMPEKQPAYAGIDPFSWWVKGEVPVNTPADAAAAEKADPSAPPAIPPAQPPVTP